MNDSLLIVKPGMDAVIYFCKKVYKRYIGHYSLSLDTVRRSRHEKKTTYLHMVMRSQCTASTVKRRIILLCCALCFAVMTSSCTTYQRVHPPSEIHQTTRREPVQKPYTINGKRYEPLSSHQGFEQEGIASSYGREFHGRTTSSGEPFDMNAMTAAHTTLPLGVYVRVQHRRSGKEVVVRINDRGPFVGDRIIDLSETAAERLGMLQEGLALVKITALGYGADGQTGSSGYRQPASYDAGTFSLQVAAFTIRDNAIRYAGELRKRFGTADVQEALVNGKTYYQVRLGRYSSLSSARMGREQYERTGFAGCFVVAVD
jgi:rare lipoprotein A